MRPFRLHRLIDVSGVSGRGVVAEGIEFENGKCALHWLTEHSSVAIYDNVETLRAIHEHGGKTRIEWPGIDWDPRGPR